MEGRGVAGPPRVPRFLVRGGGPGGGSPDLLAAAGGERLVRRMSDNPRFLQPISGCREGGFLLN